MTTISLDDFTKKLEALPYGDPVPGGPVRKRGTFFLALSHDKKLAYFSAKDFGEPVECDAVMSLHGQFKSLPA